MTNFFLYCIKKWVFHAHRRVPPTTGVVELWKKKLFCNENQWNWVVILKKMINMFTGGPIFYVCSSARNWFFFMYKGIYHIT